MRTQRIGVKVMLTFLIVATIPVAALGVYAVRNGSIALTEQIQNQLISVSEIKKDQLQTMFADRQSDLAALADAVKVMRQKAFEKLTVAQEVKKAQVEDFFNKARHDATILALSQDVYQAFHKLRTYKELRDDEVGEYTDTIDVTSDEYHRIHKAISPYFRRFASLQGYENIFIIDLDYGNVMYALHDRPDLGANLANGPLKDSRLARLFENVKSKKRIAYEDFSPYEPSGGSQAAFIGAIVLDAFGREVAVLALQLSINQLRTITLQREGMGRTGETFLVARENGHVSARSDALTLDEDYILPGDDLTGKITGYMTRALNGQNGREVFTDSRGRTDIVVYDPIDVFGNRWAIVSKVLLEEAIDPPMMGRDVDFFSDYMAKYDFNDLLLITPEGQVFFSVAHFDDYGTNLLDGDFKDSNLAHLFRRIIKTGNDGVADIRPYPAADGTPVFFMARPVTEGENVELVVAVQVPLSQLNRVMHQRQGLGTSGETYLVGPDALMRSDSQLDPDYHSVAASFADPGTGSVNTPSVKDALAGQSGVKVISGRDGEPVLSAYTPVMLGQLTWVLLAEKKRSEAFAPVDRLIWTVGLLVMLVMAVTLLAGLRLSRSISSPLKEAVEMMKHVASGDLTRRLKVGSGDEVGQTARHFNQVADTLQGVIKHLAQNAGLLSSSSESLTYVSDNLALGAEDTSTQARELTEHSNVVQGNMNHIAAAASQLKSDVDSTSAAIEEMTASIADIAKSAADSATTARSASSLAVETGQSVNSLQQSAREIDRVVEVIVEIAEQTKLLALNATIEAARAGDAGKGFAVVASEVKALAGQTAQSTGDIRARIEAIQDNTIQAVSAIEEIVLVIGKVDQEVQNIATAVEQQSLTTNDIARSMSQAAVAASEVSVSTDRAAVASQDMDGAIKQVTQAAHEAARTSNQLRTSSGDLRKQAETLKELIGRFTV
jgi:methyl-accepting chemotaxis protein